MIVLTIAAGLIYVERRLLALWQDRYGPNRVGPFGLGQVLADMIKIFMKEDWIPPFADKAVFVLAPGILIFTILLTFGVVPFAPGFNVFDSNIALLFFLGNSSLGVYSVVLGGWASNNKYSLLGAMRASAQMLTYEVFMGLSLMGVVMMSDSFNLREIVEAQHHTWFIFPQFIGFVVFMIAGIAETHRLPFDIPEAEGELVAGFHSEYSGMKFGMFFVGEYLGVTLISSLITILFFPNISAMHVLNELFKTLLLPDIATSLAPTCLLTDLNVPLSSQSLILLLVVPESIKRYFKFNYISFVKKAGI